jgi:hypothetical protein
VLLALKWGQDLVLELVLQYGLKLEHELELVRRLDWCWHRGRGVERCRKVMRGAGATTDAIDGAQARVGVGAGVGVDVGVVMGGQVKSERGYLSFHLLME